jgi:hypothetical protein
VGVVSDLERLLYKILLIPSTLFSIKLMVLGHMLFNRRVAVPLIASYMYGYAGIKQV